MFLRQSSDERDNASWYDVANMPGADWSATSLTSLNVGHSEERSGRTHMLFMDESYGGNMAAARLAKNVR